MDPEFTTERWLQQMALEALYSYEGTREINTLIVGRAVTGQSAFA